MRKSWLNRKIALLEQLSGYFGHDTISKLRLERQQRYRRAARAVTVPSICLDISITMQFIIIIFSDYCAKVLGSKYFVAFLSFYTILLLQ